jgi:hypothetical protein
MRSLASLKRLDLRDSAITDDGLVHLAEFHGLDEIRLTGSRVTPAGILRLKAMLFKTKVYP